MFSKGQIVFLILFVIAFIIVLFFAYKKDIKIHKLHYKGTIWVLIAFIAFIAFVSAIKFLFLD